MRHSWRRGINSWSLKVSLGGFYRRRFVNSCNQPAPCRSPGRWSRVCGPPSASVWFRDVESDCLSIWQDLADDPAEPGPAVELMRRALIVSEPGEQALLLDPDNADPETGEWPCYTFRNFAPGANLVGPSFRSGLDHTYSSFLANHPTNLGTSTSGADELDDVYVQLLSGDLSGAAKLRELAPRNWRAWLLAVQFDTFGAAPYSGRDLSMAVLHLWWGSVGTVGTDQALTDPVLLTEIVPMWVVRHVEGDKNMAWEIHRAPPIIAEQITRLLGEIANGTGQADPFPGGHGVLASRQAVRVSGRSGRIPAAV